MIPIFLEVTLEIPRIVGNPMEWSPPKMIGKLPVAATWATAFEIYGK